MAEFGKPLTEIALETPENLYQKDETPLYRNGNHICGRYGQAKGKSKEVTQEAHSKNSNLVYIFIQNVA